MAHTISILMLFIPFVVVIMWFLWLLLEEYGKFKERRESAGSEQILKVSACRQKYSPPRAEPTVETIISLARSRHRK